MSQHFSLVEEMAPASGCVFSATFLGEVKVRLHLPDGSFRPIPMSPNAKRVQLLAYLAWQRDQPVYRRDIENRVFRHGLPKSLATRKHLEDMFGAHTRLLRRDLREAIVREQAEKGDSLFSPEHDPLTNMRGDWALSASWFPTDLDMIKSYARFIEDTRTQGGLVSAISDEIKSVCEALIAAYPGDFLQEMIRGYPKEFHPIKTSWVREPHTFYRDWYLQAIWYTGEYEWQHWQSPLKKRWEHAERAVNAYWQYAWEACQSPIDTKLTFVPSESSERVLMSERALRRCLVLDQARGQRKTFEARYQEYSQRMTQLSQGQWHPTPETLQVVQSAW